MSGGFWPVWHPSGMQGTLGRGFRGYRSRTRSTPATVWHPSGMPTGQRQVHGWRCGLEASGGGDSGLEFFCNIPLT